MPAKALFTTTLFLFAAYFLSAQETADDAVQPAAVEEMPRFYSYECESMLDAEKRQKCADKAMLEAIYKNITYPSEAEKDGVEGTVVIACLIDAAGTLAEAKVTRSLREDVDKEALHTIQDNLLEWEPGKQDGFPVRVWMYLPVRFRLK